MFYTMDNEEELLDGNRNLIFYTMNSEEELRLENQNHLEMSHLNSPKNNIALTVLEEALSFANAHNGSWRIWTCCECKEKFDDAELHLNHVKSMHLNILSNEAVSFAKVHSIFPDRVSSDWYSMILNVPWKPVDFSAAFKILEEQYELLRSNPNEAFNAIIDESELQPSEDVLDTEEYLRNKRARKYYLTQSWPSSDDLVRREMLWIISKFLKVLLVQNYLTELHLNRVISYTLKELQHLVPSLDVSLLCLDQTHMCICFLEAPQLQKVIDFLKDLYQSSARRSSDNKYDFKDMLKSITLSLKKKERVVLNEDSLSIFLDECSLKGENQPNECSGTLNSDALRRWIGTDPSSEEELKSWRRLEIERSMQGKELLQTCQNFFKTLQHLVEKKDNQLGYKEALEAIWEYYVNELLMRGPDVGCTPRSYEEILKEIQKDPTCISQFDSYYPSVHFDLYLDLKSRSKDSFIMKAISNVLKEQPVNLTLEKSLIGFTTGVSDYKGIPEDYVAALQTQADRCIEVAVKRESEINDFELLKTDARIMQTATEMKETLLGINAFAFADFQAVLLPLVNSYMQVHKERLAAKKAPKESVTAMTIDGNERHPLHKRTAGKWYEMH